MAAQNTYCICSAAIHKVALPANVRELLGAGNVDHIWVHDDSGRMLCYEDDESCIAEPEAMRDARKASQ